MRLPDAMQADALRLLDVSRSVINATVVALWDRLDEFGEPETKYAYKQVTALMDAPALYGDRLWRCQAEQAGRILRGQAERKKTMCPDPSSAGAGHDPAKDREKTGGQEPKNDQSRPDLPA